MCAHKILIDGVIFYIQKDRPAGISRVWISWLQELAKTPLASELFLLDRGNTAPDIPGIKKISIWDFDPENYQAEAIALQQVMETEKADLLISTYYTYPENAPCMVVIHDMTPEILAYDLNHPEWRAKTRAIEKSCAYITVSQSTEVDFRKLYPHLSARPVFVIPNAVSGHFIPHTAKEIDQFRKAHGISKPYFLICGHRIGYKNADQFFKAFSLLPVPQDYEILCTGGAKRLEPIFSSRLNGAQARVMYLSDEELALTYSGALALVYPSLYEGFGLPVLEAMASGCPVITNRNSSLIDVVGDAGILVENHDVLMTRQAMLDIQQPELRSMLLEKGFRNVTRFSWERSGIALAQALYAIIDILPGVLPNTTDPVTTGVSLIYSLLRQPAYHALRSLLTESVALWNDPNPIQKTQAAERNETAIFQSMDERVSDALAKAAMADQADGLLHYWYGVILRTSGQFAAALRQFELAVEIAGPKLRVSYLAGKTALELNRMVTAGNYYDYLFQRFPDWDLIQADIKLLKKELGAVQEGMQQVVIRELGSPLPYRAKGSKNQPEVSIILPTKNREVGLLELLHSLPASLQDIPYEILLYPGNDLSPEVMEVCKQFPVSHVVYDNQVFQPGEAFSWSKLMGHGFQEARGNWLVYASDDIQFHPGAFGYALALAQQDPNIGGVTFLHRNTVETYGGVFKDYGYDSVGEFPYINFGIIRKTAFEKVNGFDPRFKFYWADVDLCMQIWQAGYRIIPSPFSLVEHNNIVDKYRTENSGDRYFQDTRCFVEKWKTRSLFKHHNPLAKQRVNLAQETVVQVLEQINGKEQRNVGSDQPVISAIVSTYNAERFLRGCLEDLEAQTIADKLEIIVVISGSQQAESGIVKEYQERFKNIRCIETVQRETVYAAWNRAIQQASGQYLTSANTDDRHTPDALEKMVAVLEESAETDVVYADCVVTRKENSNLVNGPVIARFRWPTFQRDVLFKNCFIGPQPVWRRNLHQRYGQFDELMKSAGDYEFWLRISAEAKFHHIPEVLGMYLENPGSLEHQDTRIAVQEAQTARERYWNAERPLPNGNQMFLEYYSNGFQGPNHLPLVSVIIPTYNRPQELRRALSSVYNQTYPNIEVIVVNDAGTEISNLPYPSSDKISLAVIQQEKNLGAGETRNTGIRAAQGKFIAFLDDDDIYRPEHLAALVAELEFTPGIVATYSDGLEVTADFNHEPVRVVGSRVAFSMPFSRDKLFVHNYIPINCLVVRREAVLSTGGFDGSLPALEDWEWLIRLAQIGDFSHLPFVTNEYLVKVGTQSRNMLRTDQRVNLYLQIYSRHILKTSSKIRQQQVDLYKKLTGRDLLQDLPELYGEGVQHNLLAPEKIFESLLDADDIAAELERNRNQLTPELLRLIRKNQNVADLQGDEELSTGLEYLADYVETLLAAQLTAPKNP